MQTRYSKPSADISIEEAGWNAAETTRLAQQRKLSQYLTGGVPRTQCLLCAATLSEAQAYRHRSVHYVICPACGHLQLRHRLPEGYPDQYGDAGFESIYPELGEAEYRSRRDRIYGPKLDWIVSALKEEGHASEDVLGASWLEVGCGAGYFLSALQERGARRIAGIDTNAMLVAEANRQCRSPVAKVSTDPFQDLETSSAEFIAAFFVLEHIEQAERFWQMLADKPRGTFFVFSVPAFGVATMTEGAFDDFAARNLDNVVHTQMYTDRSINHALEKAGYRMVAEWLFGQDAQDLCRMLLRRIAPQMDQALARSTMEQLTALIDPLQHVIDQARLCDARHILAVRG